MLLFSLSACETARIFSAPSGVPDVVTLIEPHLDEDDYEQYLEVLPIPQSYYISDNANTLRLSMRHPKTLNPLTNEDITVARILRLIFEPLIILDENLQPTSHLAEVEFSSDFSSVVVAIRNDAFWSDGSPVTVDDLIFSIETLRAASSYAIYRNNVENIANISHINARTARIYFHKPGPSVGVSLGFPLIPRHHYQNQIVQNNMIPIGNGPFMLEHFWSMNNMTLAKNPLSFRTSVHFEKVNVILLPNAETELNAFDQGRIDAVYLPVTELARNANMRHPNHKTFPGMYFEFIGFNFEEELFQNLHVRQGISYAIDADSIVSITYIDHAIRTTTPIHPNNFLSTPTRTPTYNPTRAKTLLMSMPITRPIVIIVNDDNPQRIRVAHNIAESLKLLDITVNVEILSYTEYFLRLDEGRFDLFVGGINLDFVPNLEFFFAGGLNDLFINDIVLQEAYSRALFSGAYDNHLDYYAEFQKMFLERVPIISLAFRHSSVLTNARISQNKSPAPCSHNAFLWVNLWD